MTHTSHLLENAFDIHIHVSPDVVPRAMDLKELSQAADAAGMARILVKDHCTSTVGRVAAMNLMSRGSCRFYSAIALNPPLGSLNPVAVEAALRAGVDVVYFPTYGAAHHIGIWGAGKPPTAFPLPKAAAFNGVSICHGDGSLVPEALDILDLIAQHDAVLATGHISPDESLVLLSQAQNRGIQRMLLTHASESVSSLTAAQQQEAVSYGAKIEHSFFAATPSCPHPITLEHLRDMIRTVGVEHVILSSDFGQTVNGNPVQNFSDHLEMMVALGFNSREVRQMICSNPKAVLMH